ncbi:DsbA family protein [Pseudoduganella sp. FT25W]|uniref:DsbA family protein n=1 Tax=Duganella alba TaxID=2666081 RepID=A0A6L5QIA5_9BURK|nr:DsbA family protein [Duganella alba]MRX08691.1 DsbA family protein [Duganella alba]MRX18253.1 DsbA family protein [Duganella alba]
MKLLYVGDPMCSWCYGFGKEMTELMAMHPELDLEIIVGGVRAGATDVLDQTGKEFRLGHWARVEAQSGLPFNRAALMARENFVYDTEPVCRAVVAARKLAPQADLLSVFRALQHAFYVDGLDTTDGRVLAGVLAVHLQMDTETVLRMWQDADTIVQTKADFVRARALGVRSFPALLLETGDGVVEVSGGYAQVEQLHQRLLQVKAA